MVGDTAMREYLETMIRELRQLRAAGSSRMRTTQTPAGSEAVVMPQPASNFKFPSQVHGYLGRDLGTVATGTCPRGEFPPGSEVPISVRVANRDVVRRLSPLFVSIEKTSAHNQVTQLSEQRFEPSAEIDLSIIAPASPGRYDLVYGYYIVSELNTTYPPFYRKACSIVVV
jgi:hypothetical protein